MRHIAPAVMVVVPMTNSCHASAGDEVSFAPPEPLPGRPLGPEPALAEPLLLVFRAVVPLVACSPAPGGMLPDAGVAASEVAPDAGVFVTAVAPGAGVFVGAVGGFVGWAGTGVFVAGGAGHAADPAGLSARYDWKP